MTTTPKTTAAKAARKAVSSGAQDLYADNEAPGAFLNLNAFHAAYAEWLTCLGSQQSIEGVNRPDDDQRMDQLQDREALLVRQMAAIPAERGYIVRSKLDVLWWYVRQQDQGEWGDARPVVLLGSIMADLTRFSLCRE